MCGCNGFAFLYCIVQLIALVAVILATVIDMFRLTSETYWDNAACITLWGSKSQCFGTSYNESSSQLWSDCSVRDSRFLAASICAVVCDIIAAFGLFAGLVLICRVGRTAIVCLLLNMLATASAIVVIALMLDSWFNWGGPMNNALCQPLRNNGEYKIGTGFILMGIGTGLLLLNTFTAILSVKQKRKKQKYTDI